MVWGEQERRSSLREGLTNKRHDEVRVLSKYWRDLVNVWRYWTGTLMGLG